MTIEQPTDQPRVVANDPWSELTEDLEARARRLGDFPASALPATCATTRRLLGAIAGTAGMMADMLDALRYGGFPQGTDPDTAAALRVDLAQAAAAAADLQHSLHSLNANTGAPGQLT